MASSSNNNYEDMMEERLAQIFDQQFENLLTRYEDRQETSTPKNKRAYIERQREQGHMQFILVKMQHILRTCFNAVFE